MKKIITLALIVFSFTTFAESIYRPLGQFEYSGLSLSFARDVEVVPQQNRERVQELLAKNYECRLITTMFKCIKFIKELDLPGALAQKINNDWINTKVQFTKGERDPELKNDSEALQEWDVYDSVSINQEKVEKYEYYILNNDLHKAKIEMPSATYYPLIQNEKLLTFPVEKTLSNGKFNWKIYNVDVIFRKK